MSLRIEIRGGTAKDHGRHLCDECRYVDRIAGSHQNGQWCGARATDNYRMPIRGRVWECTEFESVYSQVSGTNFADAWALVNLAGCGPVFLTPVEHHNYKLKGEYPERFKDRAGFIELESEVVECQ